MVLEPPRPLKGESKEELPPTSLAFPRRWSCWMTFVLVEAGSRAAAVVRVAERVALRGLLAARSIVLVEGRGGIVEGWKRVWSGEMGVGRDRSAMVDGNEESVDVGDVRAEGICGEKSARPEVAQQCCSPDYQFLRHLALFLCCLIYVFHLDLNET